MLGKGPSLRELTAAEETAYLTVSLNHVIRDRPATLAHCIDVEVIDQCGESITRNASFVVMPWVPHVRRERRGGTFFGAGDKTLGQYAAEHPILKRLADENRLLTYDFHTAPPEQKFGGPVIEAKTFSAAAVTRVLAQGGVKRIRTLGVDGGASYSSRFEDLSNKTLLPTRHQSFDSQFREIAETRFAEGLDINTLEGEDPVAVYVGAETQQSLATDVLRFSIERHSSINVAVTPLHSAIADAGIDVRTPTDPALAPRTPFSYQRFAIPALKRYRGRAIYVDSDMQVFSDIRELWHWPFEDLQVLSVVGPADSGRRRQFSVMVLDCESLTWDVNAIVSDLEAGRWTYTQLMYEMAAAEREDAVLPERWNRLERFVEDDTSLLHFTDMSTQPWLSTASPLARLWCEELLRAIDAGHVTAATVREQVERGWVRPSLLLQVEQGIADPLRLPKQAIAADDKTFRPPHTWSQSAATFHLRRYKARIRHALAEAGALDLARRIRRRLKR